MLNVNRIRYTETTNYHIPNIPKFLIFHIFVDQLSKLCNEGYKITECVR